MSQFETPKVFQARPTTWKKRIFLGLGVAGVLAVVCAVLTNGKTEYTPHFFAGGITALVFSLRFYFMQVMHGPSALTFGPEGISVSDKASHKVVYWQDIESIRLGIHGGHHWEIRSRLNNAMDFYVDGLSLQEQEDLRRTISSITIPNVHVSTFYNPLEKAA